MSVAEHTWDDPPPQEDPPDEPPPEPSPRTWQQLDATPVLDGTWAQAQPTIGRRSDGKGILYPGKVHTASSETEAGKSWFALSIAVDEITAGRHVLYLDFEDDLGGIVGRLQLLQLSNDAIRERFHYVRPLEPLGTGIHRDDLRQLMTTYNPSLGVIDGVTEAMTLHGLDPLSNRDVAAFGRLLPRPLANTGAASLSLDHVTKNSDTRGRYALGGVHKLNGLDGAAFNLDNRKPFGIGLTGISTIRIAKDRPGQLRRESLPGGKAGHWFGDLVLDSHNQDFAEVEIRPPHERDPDYRPTHTMAKLAALLDKHGPLSGAKLQALAKGNATGNREALTYLQIDGYITNTTPHQLIKPYPDEDTK